MIIYKLVNVTNTVVDAFKSLIPQLSSSCTLPEKKDLEAIVKSDNTLLFIAEEDTVIIGALTLVFNKIPTGDKVWIEDVVVDVASRGKGVGKALIEHAIAYTFGENIKSINLTSSPERLAANKLYQKKGFEKRETNVYRLTKR